MDTTTLDKHKEYTRNEFTDNKYYQTVIKHLQGIKTMIDAGGCTGEVTKIMFENIPSLKKSHVIEPIKDNYKYILENLKDFNVNVYHNALVYNKTECSFAILTNVGGATMCHSQAPITETVQTIQLEDIGLVEFLKLDIEGAERNVIENSSLIKQIPFIEIEFHHYDPELQFTEKRPAFISENFPNHEIVCGGSDGLGKESSLFIKLK